MGINIPPQSLFQNPLLMIDGTATAPAYTFAGAANQGMYRSGTQIRFANSAGEISLFGSTGLQLVSTLSLNWSSTGLGGTTDLSLFRDAANILAQRNGANAQTLRVYNTFTDASNYERGIFDWSTTANQLTIGVSAAGTGSNRTIAFRNTGGDRWLINASAGDFLAATDGAVKIGGTTTNRPSVVNVTTSFNAKSPSTVAAWLNLGASTTAGAHMNLTSGVAPTSPNNGDIWFDGTNLFMRVGGVTKTFTII